MHVKYLFIKLEIVVYIIRTFFTSVYIITFFKHVHNISIVPCIFMCFFMNYNEVRCGGVVEKSWPFALGQN